MTDIQFSELSQYIYENTYTNKNIIISDSLTPAQVQIQSQGLYDCGEIILGRTCLPRYEFTGEMGNLMALPEFSEFSNEIDVGSALRLVKAGGEIINAVVLQMEITYDKPDSFAMTFGNSLRLDDPTFIYTDLIGPVTSTATNIAGVTALPISNIPAPTPISVPILPKWTIPSIPLPSISEFALPDLDKTYTWPINNPVVGGIAGPMLPTNCYVKSIYCYALGDDGAGVHFDIEVRETPNLAGTDIMGEPLGTYASGTFNTTGLLGTSIPYPNLKAGQWIWLNIVSVTPTPASVTTFVVCMTVTQSQGTLSGGTASGTAATSFPMSGSA